MMNYDKQISRIVIIGNGFDLAHGLKTSYHHFAQKYIDDAAIMQFHQYVDLLDVENPFIDEAGQVKSIEWYSFELNMERLMIWAFQKEIGIGDNGDVVSVSGLNELYVKMERLLGKYLAEEHESHKITTLDSVQDCFDENTLAISFNYTDTVKLYTDKYYYVHGSLSDDNHIIIGFATGDLLQRQRRI